MRKILPLILCLFAVAVLAAETIVLQPDPADGKDAFITSVQPNNNFGSHIHLFTNTVSGWGHNYAGLVEFDLGEIPGYPYINISSATLEVYQSIAGSLPNTVYGVFRLTQSWDESTVTWNNKPAWSSVEATFTSSSGSQWWVFDISDLVQQWVDGTPNYGMMIIRSSGSSGNTPPVVFSSDNGSSTQRPKLTIEYTDTSNVEFTSWGEIKAF